MTKAVCTPLKVIKNKSGDVMRVIKSSDQRFHGFGEAYFSWIMPGEIKGWKRHLKMTMNIVVPHGNIRFILSTDMLHFTKYDIGVDNYCRLTIQPMIWVAFMSLDNSNSLLLNIGDIEHDPFEVESSQLKIEDITGFFK